MDGIAVARKLREGRNQTPVLMLTARDAPADIVKGLDSGADDYLTKPFSIDILLARVRAVSRRGAIATASVSRDRRRPPRSGQPRCDARTADSESDTARIPAARTADAQSPAAPSAATRILESVWGFASDVNENTLEVFMRLLRLKMDTREPKLIHTVRGFGYMMREPWQCARGRFDFA